MRYSDYTKRVQLLWDEREELEEQKRRIENKLADNFNSFCEVRKETVPFAKIRISDECWIEPNMSKKDCLLAICRHDNKSLDPINIAFFYVYRRHPSLGDLFVSHEDCYKNEIEKIDRLNRKEKDKLLDIVLKICWWMNYDGTVYVQENFPEV